ncbi:MAG: hypothetical protein K2W85_10110 [Phycisphaerales bacterium]|nr:hypothetical protein [Phycisphaerales bacterium]
MLVGPNLVLCARHQLGIASTAALPTVEQRPLRVRFRRAADGSASNAVLVAGDPCHGVYQEVDVVAMSDTLAAGSDLVMLTLARAPVGVRPIGVEIERPPLRATEVIIAGWGYGGACFGAGPGWGLRSARGMMADQGQMFDVIAFSPCNLGSIEPCEYCPSGVVGPVVLANQHDSGGAVFMEVASGNPSAPMPELRLVGTIVTSWAARRPGSWNAFGGRPLLRQGSAEDASDFDTDGVTTTTDVILFLNAYWAGDCRANVNGGPLDAMDIFAYLNAYFGMGG